MDLDSLLGLLFFVFFVVLPMIAGARKRGQGPAGPPPGQRGAPTQQGVPPRAPTAGGATAAGRGGPPPVPSTLEEIRRRVQEAQDRERAREAESRGRQAGTTTASTQPSPSRGLVSSDPFERGLVSGTGRTLAGQPTGIGREGASSEWPPPAGDPLAGRDRPSVLGREGASMQVPGRPEPARPSVLGREGALPTTSSTAQRPGSLGREGALPKSGRRPAGSLGREGYVVGGTGLEPTVAPSLLGREGGSARSRRAAAAEIGRDGTQPARAASGARLGRAALVDVNRHGILQGLIWHEILNEAPGKRLLRRPRSRPQ